MGHFYAVLNTFWTAVMRITLCLLLLLVLSSCDRSSLLAGDIAITAGIGSGRLNTPSDTTGHDKYQVEAEWVAFSDSASVDEGERVLIRYQVTFWTRDEDGMLHRHGAVLYETPHGSDRYKNLAYKWYNDYSLLVRLESAEEMSSREFYLYGWKNVSGMSLEPTEWKHPAPDIDSVSM
jgi:hypothetical protein